jgi:putative transposase
MHYRERSRRRRSLDLPGHAHELTFTCYRRHPFLSAERTCHWLADSVESARRKHDFALWAFVFMPDHAHLILRPSPERPSVSAILKSIKQPVGQRALAYLQANAPEWLPRLTRRRGSRVERLF